MNDADLLDAFVALFKPLDELIYPGAVLPAGRQTTNPAATEPLYARLPARFPSLYEMLVLSYRWQCSSVGGGYRLLANPHGTDLSGLAQELFRDKELAANLLRNGFIQFGFQSANQYDAICFQTDRRSARDYPIVRLDHEEILCNGRVKVIEVVAASFRDFVQKEASEPTED